MVCIRREGRAIRPTSKPTDVLSLPRLDLGRFGRWCLRDPSDDLKPFYRLPGGRAPLAMPRPLDWRRNRIAVAAIVGGRL